MRLGWLQEKFGVELLPISSQQSDLQLSTEDDHLQINAYRKLLSNAAREHVCSIFLERENRDLVRSYNRPEGQFYSPLAVINNEARECYNLISENQQALKYADQTCKGEQGEAFNDWRKRHDPNYPDHRNMLHFHQIYLKAYYDYSDKRTKETKEEFVKLHKLFMFIVFDAYRKVQNSPPAYENP